MENITNLFLNYQFYQFKKDHISRRQYTKLVKDSKSTMSDNIFDCIMQVASFLNIDENFPLYITKQLFKNF